MNSLGVTKFERDKTFNGYTLVTPCGGHTQSTYLIDMRGQIVHKWNTPYQGHLARLLANGNLLWSGHKEKAVFKSDESTGAIKLAGRTGGIIEFDWNGKILWKYENPELHHDHYRLKNGNTLLIAWEKIPESIAKLIKGRSIDDEPIMWGDIIFEVDNSGNTVWEWHGYEHLNPKEDVICGLCGYNEWTHCNSVFETVEGDILTSFRQTNTVGILDKKSGDWKWKYGTHILGHQHDPTQLENGNILIFDNGVHARGSIRSRVIEVDPNEDKIVWEYFDPRYLGFFSDAISSAQRLPNGNTLICEGQRGRLFEVTHKKEIVWEYKSPFYSRGRNNIFKAYRFGPEYSAFKGKELDESKFQWLNHLYTH